MKKLYALFVLISVSSVASDGSTQDFNKYDNDIEFISGPSLDDLGLPKPNKSAYCCVSFDVNEIGRTENLNVSYCSSPVFKKVVLERYKRFVFSPAMKGHKRVRRDNVFLTPSYIKYDKQSLFPIPDSEGFLAPKLGKIIPARPKTRMEKRKWLVEYFDSEFYCPKIIS